MVKVLKIVIPLIFILSFIIFAYYVISAWADLGTQEISNDKKALDSAKQIQQKALDLKKQGEDVLDGIK